MSAASSTMVPKHFLVVIPGFAGSKLRHKNSNKLVWGDFSSLPLNLLEWVKHFDELSYPNDNLEPAGIMDKIVWLEGFAKLDQYTRMLDALQQWGYQADQRVPEEDRNVYAFDYDWRQDNRISARQLRDSIERWRSFHPGATAWIIAHSMGGLVARWYIEHEGGKDGNRVGRLFLLGSPWDGSPKALYVLFYGFNTFIRLRLGVTGIPQRTRALLRTLPSIYQLLPHFRPFLNFANGNTVVDFANDIGWLDSAEEEQLFLDAQRFNQQLSTNMRVPTTCFFGNNKLTITRGDVYTGAYGRWTDVMWTEMRHGDETVPEYSAIHATDEPPRPFHVKHGNIYAYEPVLNTLKYELIDKFFSGGTPALPSPPSPPGKPPEQAGPLGPRAHVTPELGGPIGPWASDPTTQGDPPPSVDVTLDLSWDEEFTRVLREKGRLKSRDIFGPNYLIPVRVDVRLTKSGKPVRNAEVFARLKWRESFKGEGPGPDEDEYFRPKTLRRIPKTKSKSGYFELIMSPSTEGYYEVQIEVRIRGYAPVEASELILIENAEMEDATDDDDMEDEMDGPNVGT
jgi:pimeloyl-ACP methyl ester carboxylesterase